MSCEGLEDNYALHGGGVSGALMVEGYGSADNKRVVTGLMNVVVRCCEEGTHAPQRGYTAAPRPLGAGGLSPLRHLVTRHDVIRHSCRHDSTDLDLLIRHLTVPPLTPPVWIADTREIGHSDPQNLLFGKPHIGGMLRRKNGRPLEGKDSHIGFRVY